MTTDKYCIMCEKWVEVLGDGSIPVHIKFIAPTVDSPEELDWCEGPFTTSEPPALTEEMWETILANEPDVELLENNDM